MRKILLLLGLICTSIFGLQAVEGLKFENITHKDGLSHNTVRSIMQDSRGFMWICTVNGLNRYDGHRFLHLLPEFDALSLPENNIRQTLEDPSGYIWIQTTTRFVNCYDTHTGLFVDYTGKNEIRNYTKIDIMPAGDVWMWGASNGACHVHYQEGKPVPTLYDINNIGTNGVSFVLTDESGQIWIGTDKGLVQLSNQVPRFCNTGNHTYDYHNAIECKDRIYFFTNNGVILVFDKQRKVFLPVIPMGEWEALKMNEITVLDDHRILVTGKQNTLVLDTDKSRLIPFRDFTGGTELRESFILTDNRNNAWIYNKSGNIWRYRKDLQQFEKFNLIPEAILSVIDLERYDVYCDSRDITWITTYGNGLYAIEESGEISHYTTENSGLKTNYLLSVSEDHLGNIWIGTENAGISKISLTRYNNRIFLPEANKVGNIDRTIRCIFEDPETRNLWVGTKDGDVYVFDEELQQKSRFQLRQGSAYCITSDSSGNIWIATKGDGLLVIPKGKTTTTEGYSLLLSDDHKSGANNIYDILCDRKGRMWVGTFGSGLYLCELKDDTLHATAFPVISGKQKQVRCLIQDQSGRIWAGGENGIVVFDPDSLMAGNDDFEWFHFNRSDPGSLSNNIVKSMIEDSQGRIWIGTSGGGLNQAIRNTSKGGFSFRHYTSEEGLTNNMVQAILEDESGILWISTESGISRFDPDGILFDNYSFPDTWENEYFSEATACKRKNGELLFGSFSGMYIFNPSSFESHTTGLPVTITGLSVNGTPVTPNTPDSPLTQSIDHTRSIRLKDGQNSFGIEFSSLNFLSSHSNRYTYILENYDKEWNPVTQYNVATYRNIPAGRYVFRVRNINNPNAWEESQETTLEIFVVPPFWKSPQAIVLYLLLLLVGGYIAVRLVIKMNKLHNEVEVEKQLTELRLKFFTNISHEFRTPLTIIRGSIESMNKQDSLPAPLKKDVRTLEKSSSKLMRLIDQLLEFRKVQNEPMELQLEYVEATGFLHDLYDMFVETAERKQIEYIFSASEESRILLLDKNKIEKIVFNLLSNAFKHTPEKGCISMEVTFDKEEKRLILKVSDSGIGIPPEKRHLLFVRFKQINYTPSGIGIGLHLTSELTRIHKGEIDYSDSQWGGACFTVHLPMNAETYDAADRAPSVPVSVNYSPATGSTEDNAPAEDQAEEIRPGTPYRILLIEDDEEIRLFLEEQLKGIFTIATAADGLAGWQAAVNDQPNLILCDVMMPEMDGFEVTRKLKSDFETSHIPIIMLTAHSSMEHQLEGINAGADAYIIKPFSMDYLVSRITKLIEQREKLQHKFARESGILPPAIHTTNRDSEFIRKIHEIIEAHMDNPDFSVDDFAQATNMGRTLFYKKIKGLTNYSPNEYLRIIRLKKASELLKTTDLNVSEIAYKVGFNDPDYFSKCFREHFEMRPTQFRTSGDASGPSES